MIIRCSGCGNKMEDQNKALKLSSAEMFCERCKEGNERVQLRVRYGSTAGVRKEDTR